MSANGKRVLPTTAASTAALVPFSHPGYATGQPGKGGDNEDLIDQLVGGLVQADRSTKSEANFFNQREDAGNYGRTYSIDDEEIDEPPVPIPSTWQATAATKEPSWLAEQLKASAYGFIIGLFVVIPAVMLLTGQTERLPTWAAVSQYASTTATQLGFNLNLEGDKAAVASDSNPIPSTTASRDIAAAPNRAPAQAENTSANSVAAPAGSREVSTTTTTPPVAAETPPPAQQAAEAEKAASPAPAAQPTETVALTQPSAAKQTPASTPEQPVVLAPAQPLTSPSRSSLDDPAAPPPAAPAASQVESADPAAQPAQQPRLTEQETASLTESLANSFGESAAPESAVPSALPSAGATDTSSQTSDPMPDALTIETAQFLMKNGKMEDGRGILAKLASRGNAAAIFALAESFDPNVLAAWGASGQVAQPEKAKIFYSMALSQGVEAAIPRLKGLE